jgi:hypothetical protein
LSELLPDGVYIDLAPEEYFKQGRGSTDLMKLFEEGEGWWWQSEHNPMLPKRKTTPAMTYGSALHAIMLEGVGAYDDRFRVAPDYGAIEGLCTTKDEVVAALAAKGLDVKFPGASKLLAPDWFEHGRNHGVPVRKNLEDDFLESLIERNAAGEVVRTLSPVSVADDWGLRFMAQMALDPHRDDNAEIRHLFDRDGQHPPLAEISILKTMPDGMRRRWRIDRLFASFNLDLKALDNYRGSRMAWTTGDRIAKMHYDLQRADYDEGRAAAYEFIRDGFKVQGGTIEQRNYLRQLPDIAPKWTWLWIFYQKPDPVAGRAPVIFPVMDVTELLTSGLAKKRVALATYRRCVETYGLDRPWGRVDPLHYADEDLQPRVFVPPWNGEGLEPDDA